MKCKTKKPLGNVLKLKRPIVALYRSNEIEILYHIIFSETPPDSNVAISLTTRTARSTN